MSRFLLFVFAACMICMATASAEEAAEFSGELSVIHAGSLSVPFRELSALFMEQYPGVTVLAESHGSRDCARKVSELDINYDVMGSADYSVIDTLLIPDHAAYAIRFATNEMAIVYTERSLYADEITAENWPEVLLRDDVAFGRADPNRDPCGYRTVMTFQLAETYYGKPGLGNALADKDGQKYIRPKETDLLALLEAGEIDYLFIYRSVAEQHGLKLLLLSDQVNLKSAELANLYATATVELTGKKPGEFITKKGAPMVYGITMPLDAEQDGMALAYIELLLSPEGQAVMKRNGQPPINPPYCEQYDELPDVLKPLCTGPEV
jgi:molybdate/tungstate transport system substrate-binding protein